MGGHGSDDAVQRRADSLPEQACLRHATLGRGRRGAGSRQILHSNLRRLDRSAAR